MKAEVWIDADADNSIGTIILNEDEVNHFKSAPICIAKACLTSKDIFEMGIDEDDYVHIVVN